MELINFFIVSTTIMYIAVVVWTNSNDRKCKTFN